jgi:hypothetical protein
LRGDFRRRLSWKRLGVQSIRVGPITLPPRPPGALHPCTFCRLRLACKSSSCHHLQACRLRCGRDADFRPNKHRSTNGFSCTEALSALRRIFFFSPSNRYGIIGNPLGHGDADMGPSAQLVGDMSGLGVPMSFTAHAQNRNRVAISSQDEHETTCNSSLGGEMKWRLAYRPPHLCHESGRGTDP